MLVEILVIRFFVSLVIVVGVYGISKINPELGEVPCTYRGDTYSARDNYWCNGDTVFGGVR